jgi:hypothetical protein
VTIGSNDFGPLDVSKNYKYDPLVICKDIQAYFLFFYIFLLC